MFDNKIDCRPVSGHLNGISLSLSEIHSRLVLFFTLWTSESGYAPEHGITHEQKIPHSLPNTALLNLLWSTRHVHNVRLGMSIGIRGGVLVCFEVLGWDCYLSRSVATAFIWGRFPPPPNLKSIFISD